MSADLPAAAAAWRSATTALEDERLRLASYGGGSMSVEFHVDSQGNIRVAELVVKRKVKTEVRA